MAKRPRRRVVVLESDDEEDGADQDGKSHSALQFITAQSGGQSETSPKRKHQKSSHQPTLNSLFEAKRTISSKGSCGRLPLEVITKSAAKPRASSRTKKERNSVTLEDLRKPNLKQHPDERLWVDKYSPRSVGELVVHSKKVAEVKDWLQGQLLNPYGATSRVLVLTGPAGVGKTAVVHVLGELLKFELVEWTTPAPELWQEYSHHAASGGPYMSKLDEFEAFIGRARNMSSLPMVSVALSTSQQVRPFSGDDRATTKGTKILLIDDVPLVNSRYHHDRRARIFHHLALSRNFPAIVIVTDDAGASERIEERGYQPKDLIDTLERGGAKKIVFNPVTVNAMRKLLNKVQILENCRLSFESLSLIAESSAGDIRQSLTSLQFLCLGLQSHSLHPLMWDPGGFGSSQTDNLMMKANEMNAKEPHIQINKSCTSACGGRDFSFSLFHALGKFLHNKRHSDKPVHSGVELKEEFQRHPLNMEEPEAVLSQAHTETATVLAFLHENVLQFIDENSIDDVEAIAAYFSDTDCLLGARRSLHSRCMLINADDVGPSQVASAAANSIAARGVLFGSSHPAPRRWQSLRAPALWQVERQTKQNKGVPGVFDTRTLSGCVQAMELHPFYQKLSSRIPLNFSTKNSHAMGTGKLGEAMDIEECDMEDCSDTLLQDLDGTSEGDVLKTTFMQMSVEDDIEDEED